MTKPFLAACAVHKLEGKRLHEWIEYHRLVGFEHFFLFDNNDVDDGSSAIVKRYVAEGIATSVRVKGKYQGSQMRIYEWLFRKNPATWIAFIDIDEFILPISCDWIPDLLPKFERFAGLAMSWRCFGSGGHIAAPPFVTESLIHASKPGWPNNRHVKCIIKPDRVARCTTPHDFETIPRQHVVNENFAPVIGPWMNFTDSKIVVNHYILRSVEDFKLKALRGRGDDLSNPYDQKFFEQNDTNDLEETRLADRFAAEVRRRCEPSPQ
jgi:hypothetical protein